MLRHILKNPKELTAVQKKESVSSAGRLLAAVAGVAIALLVIAAWLGAGASSPLYYTVVQAQVMLPRIAVVVPLVVGATYLGALIYQAFKNTLLVGRVAGSESQYLHRTIIYAAIVASTVVSVVLGVMGNDMALFKVGDRVQLAKAARAFYGDGDNQGGGGGGEVTMADESRGRPYRVMWDTGAWNTYVPGDLEAESAAKNVIPFKWGA